MVTVPLTRPESVYVGTPLMTQYACGPLISPLVATVVVVVNKTVPNELLIENVTASSAEDMISTENKYPPY